MTLGRNPDTEVLVMIVGAAGKRQLRAWAAIRGRRHSVIANVDNGTIEPRKLNIPTGMVGQGELRQQRPIEDFPRHPEQEAEAFTPAAEEAVTFLRLRRPLFDRPKSFEQIAGIGVCRQRVEMKSSLIACSLATNSPANAHREARSSA